MPNYAIGTTNRINNAPFVQALSQMGSGQAMMGDLYPEALFEQYLQALSPSSTQERQLRSAYPSLQNRWTAKLLSDFSGAPYRFADFLGDFDVNRELARVSPGSRNEDPSRYSGRARWVQFS